MFKQFSDLVYDATLGLAKQYQTKAVDLVKIEAAALYIKGVKALREHCLALLMLAFCFMVLAFAVVVMPLALVLALDLGLRAKMLAVVLLGIVDICVPLAVINRYLSEKTWMQASKSDELLEKVINS